MRSRHRTTKRKAQLAHTMSQPRSKTQSRDGSWGHAAAVGDGPVAAMDCGGGGVEAPCVSDVASQPPEQWVTVTAARVTVKPRPFRPASTEPVVAIPQPVRETVPRLDVAQGALPAHAMRAREVAVEAVHRRPRRERQLEEAWQGRARLPWKWWACGGVAVAMLLAASVASVLALNTARQASSPRPAVSGYELEKVELDERFAFFQEDPIPLQAEAVRLLAGYTAARSADEALGWVRDPEQLRGRLQARWKPWPAAPRLERQDALQYAFTDSMNPPFMVLLGKRADHLPFRAYFVRDDGRLRLDWEATEGVCDIPIHELAQTPVVRGAVVRCELKAQPFYTASMPESGFNSFSINSADRQSWVWGYAERDSALDRRLKEALDAGGAIWEAKERERMTLRITSAPGREQPNQFLITDMLHIDWVRP